MKRTMDIGIEIHLVLKIKTKMFSGAPADPEAAPNSCVAPLDLGCPGAMPVLNRKGVELAVRACAGLQCEIDPLIRFDRKNYYYPDLTKGYQITQQFFPLGKNGKLELPSPYDRVVRISRVHMEEDTAKQIHKGEETFLDFNRSGVGLVEIVTEPDLHNGEEAAAYVSALREMMIYLGVSDAKMEEGSLRCDVNVSLRQPGDEKPGVRCEIKNLNSIANIRKAVKAEAQRQEAVLDAGGKIETVTLRYDEASGKTVIMRRKEDFYDYRYFPEPDIPVIRLSDQKIGDMIRSMPELPSARRARMVAEYGIDQDSAAVLTSLKDLGDFFEKAVKAGGVPSVCASYLLTEVQGWLKRGGTQITNIQMSPENLAVLSRRVKDGTISRAQASGLLEELMAGEDPEKLIEKKGLRQLSDPETVRGFVKEVLLQHPEVIADYKAGKKRALGYLTGLVLKQSGGKANPSLANRLIQEEIDKAD